MKRFIGILLGLFLVFGAVNSYAISVKVQTSSSQVSALGFTVNGKNYGGAGKSYSKSNSPAGNYTFGVRVNGLFGKDVGCPVGSSQSVALKNDTTVTLNYDGSRCIARVR